MIQCENCGKKSRFGKRWKGRMLCSDCLKLIKDYPLWHNSKHIKVYEKMYSIDTNLADLTGSQELVKEQFYCGVCEEYFEKSLGENFKALVKSHLIEVHQLKWDEISKRFG